MTVSKVHNASEVTLDAEYIAQHHYECIMLIFSYILLTFLAFANWILRSRYQLPIFTSWYSCQIIYVASMQATDILFIFSDYYIHLELEPNRMLFCEQYCNIAMECCNVDVQVARRNLQSL